MSSQKRRCDEDVRTATSEIVFVDDFLERRARVSMDRNPWTVALPTGTALTIQSVLFLSLLSLPPRRCLFPLQLARNQSIINDACGTDSCD